MVFSEVKIDTNKVKRNKVDNIFKKAMDCHTCFDNGVAERALIDLAQPRWIGRRYFNVHPKVIIVTLNPGAGNSPEKRELNSSFLQILRDYKNDKKSLQELFDFQGNYIPKWGNPSGKFLKFYTKMGLEMENIVLANVAWCADAKNKWSTKMLATCFNKHTKELIEIINPDIAILSGSGTHKFDKKIKDALPTWNIIKTLHYAHREGKTREKEELERVKEEISKYC